MSVLLQSMQTAKYVRVTGGWTEQPEQAADFSGGTEALIYCYQHHLKDMQILGQFEDPRRNFKIPLNPNTVE